MAVIVIINQLEAMRTSSTSFDNYVKYLDVDENTLIYSGVAYVFLDRK